jgi:phage shock protein PspC (stress-responsive transcriptional regulator)
MAEDRPRLRRSRDKMIAGVCGGIAEWVGWDPTLVRLLYVLVSILSAAFPGILAYVVLWIVMPEPVDDARGAPSA